MHLFFKQCIGFLTCGFVVSFVHAGQLGAKLNLQIELESSCQINNQPVSNGTNGVSLGQFDFGQTTASFNHVIETSLTNGATSGLTIQCLSNSPLKITFGAGQYDSKVPSTFQANYFRALSNGTDYLAYNIVYGSARQVLRPNQVITLSNSGQSQTLDLKAQAVNNGQSVSVGHYTDTIPITIEF
ncbi:spore coat protein U domain-containing protein [Acinetobacter bereziniae]|uniref:spore coat protein U domain-containing protein n=1 Tax=Acinetobacter bereziniae TaxID=106648 RepID=UPI0012500707|nr:spore coat protein U domain-containing protein [Acinetobacter bereziniae]